MDEEGELELGEVCMLEMDANAAAMVTLLSGRWIIPLRQSRDRR